MNQKLWTCGAQQSVTISPPDDPDAYSSLRTADLYGPHIKSVCVFSHFNKFFLSTSSKIVLCDRDAADLCCLWASTLTRSVGEEWTLRNSLKYPGLRAKAFSYLWLLQCRVGIAWGNPMSSIGYTFKGMAYSKSCAGSLGYRDVRQPCL